MRNDSYKLNMSIKTNVGKEKVSIMCYNEGDIEENGIPLDLLVEHIKQALNGLGYVTDGLEYFTYEERKAIKERYPDLVSEFGLF